MGLAFRVRGLGLGFRVGDLGLGNRGLVLGLELSVRASYVFRARVLNLKSGEGRCRFRL